VNATKVPDWTSFGLLLAEDNFLNQEVILHWLKKTGVAVTVVENGAQAVEQLQKQRFDLVLMDLQMPVMDGFEAVQKIRTFDSDTTIIALSATTLDEDKRNAFSAGMNAYLGKPIDEKELYQTVSQFLMKTKEVKSSGIVHSSVDYLVDWGLVGFDMAQAIRSAAGNISFLQGLLRKFRVRLLDEFSDLPDQILNQDPTSLRRVHTLKGIASMLGAKKILEIATVINDLLTTKSAVTPKQVADLKASIDFTVQELLKVPELQSP
jgi:two-component system, sensor histidine kinase and response regulator